MADYCRVTVVGNLSSDIQQLRSTADPSQVIGITSVCMTQTQLNQGEIEHVPLAIPIEIPGAARSARAAQMFGAGSRIVLDGHLEQREATVRVPYPRLVLIVDAIFNADVPLSLPEVQPFTVYSSASNAA